MSEEGQKQLEEPHKKVKITNKELKESKPEDEDE